MASSPQSSQPDPRGMLVIGGLRERSNATWPLARLEVGPDGIRLGPSAKPLGFVVPTYFIPWVLVSEFG